MPNPDSKRLYQFKGISLLLFSLLIILLIYLFSQVLNLGNSDAINNDDSINQSNFAYSRGNSFGFTDKERNTAKPKGIFRIAVIGDSFVWGNGLPYEKAWSHKLEKKLSFDYDSLEVLHWGKGGWSTLDEFNFFKEHGKDFDIDLLIIGWVDNDPDIGKIPKVSIYKADKEFPVLYKICRPLANLMWRIKKIYEYRIWLHQLYNEKNLEDYQNLLNEFRNYLSLNNVKVLCVMTPGPFNAVMKNHFEITEPIIIKAGFPCLNLYPATQKKLGHYSYKELRANTMNGHPGELMTEEFAIEVKDYLEQNGYLKGIPGKKI